MYSETREFLERFDEVYFLILALVLAFGMIQTTGTAMNTEKPVVTVISPSMCPQLQIGDILFVRGVNYSEVQVEDVVVYTVPDRMEFSLDGEKYVLEGDEENPDSVETPAGNVTLLDVIPRQTPEEGRSRDLAVIEFNGQTVKVNGNPYLTEGETYSFSGHTLSVDYLTDLPRGDTPVVHRVVEKNPDYFQTMGDNNQGQIEFEKRIEPDQLHGKVFFKVPRLGLVKLVTMDLLGFNGGAPLKIDSTPSC